MEQIPQAGITPAKKTKTTKRVVPKKQATLFDQAKTVGTYWDKNPDITLLWMTPKSFLELANLSSADFIVKKVDTGERAAITSELARLNLKIDEGIKGLKSMIANKHGNEANARPYYAKFGIFYKNKKYDMPDDKSSRLASLALVLSGLESEGLNNAPLGKAYWQGIYNEYLALTTEGDKTDGSISHKVGSTAQASKLITKTLNCLTLLIKANYPDTYHAELRSRGFLK